MDNKDNSVAKGIITACWTLTAAVMMICIVVALTKSYGRCIDNNGFGWCLMFYKYWMWGLVGSNDLALRVESIILVL